MAFYKDLNDVDKRLKALREEGKIKEPYIKDISYSKYSNQWEVICVLPTREIAIGGKVIRDNGSFGEASWTNRFNGPIDEKEKKQVYDLWKKYNQEINDKVKKLYIESN